jgi:hypothetical protein
MGSGRVLSGVGDVVVDLLLLGVMVAGAIVLVLCIKSANRE